MTALCSTTLTSVLGGFFFFLDIARDNLEALYCVWTHLVSRYRVVLLHASIPCQLPVTKYRQPIANALNIHANLNMRYNARHDGHNRAHYTHLSTTFPLWFHPLEPVWTFIYIYVYITPQHLNIIQTLQLTRSTIKTLQYILMRPPRRFSPRT